MAVLGAAWVLLGAVTLVAAIRARKSRRALLVGRLALGTLFVLAGALVNAVFLATGTDYTGFADLSFLPFVRDTWRSVVAPNQVLFIGLLIAFEATAGVLVLLGGKRAELGMLAILGFHVGLLFFGLPFWTWAIPMLVAVGLLLRAQRSANRAAATAETAAAVPA
jgi:hypothetical protein